MSAPVFLADPPLGEVSPGGRFVLTGAEGRHAGVVQRRAVGERVDVVDGVGTRLRCVIEHLDAGEVTLTIREVCHEPLPGVRLVLVQALAKGDRDEMAIEAATEVGADAVVPWRADRSIVVWRGDRAAKSRARWLATVRAATKQSRRARIPVVDDAVDSKGLARRVAQAVAGGGAVVVLHEDAQTPLAKVLLPVAGEVLVVVGPEGGISDVELAAFTAAGAVPARLGPHVLRTSTAGPVALALLAERLGLWDVPPSAGNVRS